MESSARVWPRLFEFGLERCRARHCAQHLRWRGAGGRDAKTLGGLPGGADFRARCIKYL